jgi:hypothetical protein
MMSSSEGRAPDAKPTETDVSELRDSYHQLLRAIDRNQIDVIRHLIGRIDAQQLKSPGLSATGQEAFERLALAATTEDVTRVREALQAFRSVLRANSSAPPPPAAVCVASTVGRFRAPKVMTRY